MHIAQQKRLPLCLTRGIMPLESGSSDRLPVDVFDRVLDKGIIIDAAVRLSIAGIELLGVDARVVVASIETYLRHADTIAYTDMVAAPKRAPPPPLYAEPLVPVVTRDVEPPGYPGPPPGPATPIDSMEAVPVEAMDRAPPVDPAPSADSGVSDSEADRG
jgi:hypothetical protein